MRRCSPRSRALARSALKRTIAEYQEEGDNLIVKVALPGLKPDEVKIRVQGDVLTITGESKEDPDKDGRNYQLREHLEGWLERSVVLRVPGGPRF